MLTGVNDPTFISTTGHNPARAATIRKYGIHSVLSVPIRARGVTLGVAVFVRGQRPEPFEQDDVLLAEELTTRAALSLDKPAVTPASGPPLSRYSAACCRNDSPNNRPWRWPAATCPPVPMPAWEGTGSM